MRGGKHECTVCKQEDPRGCLLKCTKCEARHHLQCTEPPPPDDFDYQKDGWVYVRPSHPPATSLI